jgi:hypothetical protein
MIGKIFITRTGYDPLKGKHIKDPYLEGEPSLGACRPDIRKKLQVGDHVLTVSGKVPGVNQFVMSDFEVARKLHALDARKEYPQQRLRLRDDGQLTGNVIVTAGGKQHRLDGHDPKTFSKRLPNYIVGCNALVLSTEEEVERGRAETMEALQEILKKKGKSPIEVVGRWGTTITEEQIEQFRAWLRRLKAA